jgi:hypothetical protein
MCTCVRIHEASVHAHTTWCEFTSPQYFILIPPYIHTCISQKYEITKHNTKCLREQLKTRQDAIHAWDDCANEGVYTCAIIRTVYNLGNNPINKALLHILWDRCTNESTYTCTIIRTNKVCESDPTHKTLLHIVAQRGHEELVRVLAGTLRMYACWYVCVCLCVYVYIWSVGMYLCEYLDTKSLLECLQIRYVCIHAYMYVHVCMFIYMNAYVHDWMLVCVTEISRTCMCMYVHAHVCVCMCMYVHARTYVYVYARI